MPPSKTPKRRLCLHCLFRKTFIACSFPGVSGTVIFQSVHHSGKRLSMWHLSGILQVKFLSKGSPYFSWTFSFSKLTCNISKLFYCKGGILHFEASHFYFTVKRLISCSIEYSSFMADVYLDYRENNKCLYIIFTKKKMLSEKCC